MRFCGATKATPWGGATKATPWGGATKATPWGGATKATPDCVCSREANNGAIIWQPRTTSTTRNIFIKALKFQFLLILPK